MCSFAMIRSSNEESLFFITAANVRDSPHVAPCAFAIVIGFARITFLCLSACKSTLSANIV